MRQTEKLVFLTSFVASLSLIPLAAIAGDASNAVIMSTGQMITGAVGSANSSITGAVTTTGSTINSTLTSVGNMIAGEFKTQDELLGNLVKTQIQAQRDLMVAQQIAETKQRAIELYGDQGADPTCINEEQGQSIGDGRAAMAKSIVAAGKAMEKRVHSGSATASNNEKVKDLLSLTDTEATLENIYPKNGTLTEEQKEIVSKTNQLIVDPYPPNKISSRVKEGYLGKKYEAMRLDYERAKLAPRQATLVIEAMKSSDFPTDTWAKGAWEDMGKTGTPDGVDPKTNKMSYDAFIELYVRSRIDNQNWYKRFDTENDHWHMKQMNMNSAMLLEIEYRQMKLLEHLVENLAHERANNIDKEKLHALNELQRQTESAP
jgi:hypothetical protein